MFTPLFRVFMALLLVALCGLLVWAKAWLAALFVGACTLICIVNIVREIMDVKMDE